MTLAVNDYLVIGMGHDGGRQACHGWVGTVTARTWRTTLVTLVRRDYPLRKCSITSAASQLTASFPHTNGDGNPPENIGENRVGSLGLGWWGRACPPSGRSR
jgi:hypothetical protein